MGHQDRRSQSEPANAQGTPLERRSADDATALAPSLGDLTMSRRQLIRRVAVAGSVAWVAPVITTIRPAAAETLSRPPGPKSGATGGAPTRSAVSGNETSVSKSVAATAAGGAGPHVPLARTGADIGELAALGFTSGALGTAAVLWSRRGCPEPAPDAKGGAPAESRHNRDIAAKNLADELPGQPPESP